MDNLNRRGLHGPGGYAHKLSAAFERLEERRLLSTPGSFDPTFGSAGITAVPGLGPVNIQTVAGAAAPEGKTLLLGTAYPSLRDRWPIIARLNADGTPDSSFGTDGVLLSSPSSRRPLPSMTMPTSIAVDNQGRIYVGGNSEVIRLTAEGLPDYTFGRRGVARVDIYLRAMTFAPDGSIVVGGSQFTSRNSDTYSYAVSRLTADGRLDATFGQGGIVTTPMHKGPFDLNSSVRSLAIQPDGRILAGGGDQGYLEIARYKADGSLDKSFGVKGIIRDRVSTLGNTVFDESDGGPYFESMTLRASDGAIFAAGGYPDAGGEEGNAPMVVSEFDRNGKPVASFGENGVVSASTGTDGAMATGVTLLPGGQLLVSGFSTAQGAQGILLARLNADGSGDPTFGTSLTAVSGDEATGLNLRLVPTAQPLASRTLSNAVLRRWTSPPLLTRNGGLIVPLNGGPTGDTADQLTALRLNADGTLDRHFGRSGVAIAVTAQQVSSDADSVVISPDGSIGVAYDASRVTKLSPDGAIVGQALQFPHSDAHPAVLLGVQPDGKLLVQITEGETNDFYLARYNSDGSIDTTFHDHGTVAPQLFGSIRKLVIRPDGQIIFDVVVLANGGFSVSSDTLYSVSPAGTISGTAQLPTTFKNDFALTPTGQLVVTGENNSALELKRLDGATLATDASFGNNGSVALTAAQLSLGGAGPVPTALAIDSVGRMFVAVSDEGGCHMIKFSAAGQIDPSFGTHGVAAVAPRGEIFSRDLLVTLTGELLFRLATPIDSYNFTYSVGRLQADGALDEAFDEQAALFSQPVSVVLQEINGTESLIVAGNKRLHAYDGFNEPAETAYVARIEL